MAMKPCHLVNDVFLNHGEKPDEKHLQIKAALAKILWTCSKREDDFRNIIIFVILIEFLALH